MKKLCILVLLILLATLVGCSFVFPDTTKLGDEYYQSIQAKDYQKAIDLCDEKYLDKLPKEDAIRLLQVVNSKLGDLVSYKLESTEGKSQVSNRGSYARFVVTYRVKYEKGSAKEILVIGREGTQTELRLWDYIIDSPDLIFAK